MIDEVRVWNSVRSAAEIETYHCERLAGTEPGLVAYWRFNEGSGTTAIGLLNNNDGQLGGGYSDRIPTWVSSGVRGVCDCPWFAIRPDAQTGPGGVELSWPARTNRVYQIQYRSNLAKGYWIPLMDTNIIGCGMTSCVPDIVLTNAPQRFYRLQCLTNQAGW